MMNFKLSFQNKRQKTFYFTKQICNISSSRMFRNIACFHIKNNDVKQWEKRK
jgi:hypothetical protein